MKSPVIALAGLLMMPPALAQTPPAAAGSALGHSAPGQHGNKTPVVAAPANTHAQKPAATKPPAPPPATVAEPAKPADPVRPPGSAEPPKGSVTGMPLPRWASLRSDEVNMRTGPGTRYPIDWVYRRRDLPVQIEREFEVWRLIEDQDGVKGWVHQATLTGRRSFVVKDAERVMHRSASEDSAPVARLKPGVVGRLRACDAKAAWCEVQVGDYRGYLRREEVYGIYAGEAVN